MKVAIVVSHLEKSGPINVVYNIVKNNIDKVDFCIITLSDESNKSMKSNFDELNVPIIGFKLSRRDSIKIYRDKLKETLKHFKPDIIHTHGFRSDFLVESIDLFREIHITTLHNYPYNDYPDLYGKIRGNLLAFLHLKILNKIKNKISCSYSIAEKYNKYGIEVTDVIQNGVDKDVYYRIDEIEKLEIKRKLNIPSDKKIVLSAGALIERKRPDLIIRTFEKLALDDVLLVVLGDGPLFDNLKSRNSKQILMLGSVSNVSDYMKISDIFISNSKAEGLPMAMLEALATDLNIVASDIDSHREIHKLVPRKVFLYKDQHPESVQKKLKESLFENHTINGEEMYKISSENMSRQYFDFYLSVSNR